MTCTQSSYIRKVPANAVFSLTAVAAQKHDVGFKIFCNFVFTQGVKLTFYQNDPFVFERIEGRKLFYGIELARIKISLIRKHALDDVFRLVYVLKSLHCGDDGYIPFKRPCAEHERNFLFHVFHLEKIVMA